MCVCFLVHLLLLQDQDEGTQVHFRSLKVFNYIKSCDHVMLPSNNLATGLKSTVFNICAPIKSIIQFYFTISNLYPQNMYYI